MGISREYAFDSMCHSRILLRSPVKANILIDQTGRARLADFGLLTIIKDPTNLLTSTTYSQGGSARWMSPELIDPQQFGLQHSRPTESSDCYAFGMVIYETITGNPPFHEDADITVFVKVMQGKRPPRGGKFRKDLWGMLERCWESQPSSRPSIGDVLRCLETYSDSSQPPSAGATFS
jgi:serine/threonine protein kinase